MPKKSKHTNRKKAATFVHGNTFVEEHTGSAVQINVDGRHTSGHRADQAERKTKV